MIDRSIMLPTNPEDFDNDPIALAVRRAKRKKALEARPTDSSSIDRVECGNCKKMMPIEWLEHEVCKKILCVDGIIYCINCAKMIVKGMQKELLGKNKQERIDMYKTIEDKIVANEALEKLKNKDIVEEVDLLDNDKMTKLMRNRSGSNDSKTLNEQIKENVHKELHKDE